LYWKKHVRIDLGACFPALSHVPRWPALRSAAAIADMAAAEKLTTPAMAKRYGLSNSTADQFTLSNIALLATFTLCGIR
jgi:hypothetical protein